MAAGGNLSIFVPINKIDEEQRLVYGQVAAEVLDNSGEMFDYEGSKPYFQKWSDNAHVTSGGKSKGNLRVMHTSKVAGIVTDLGFDDDSRTIEACTKVIDDAEWEMVKAGGYTGFSMGGRYVSRAEKADGVKTYVADPVEISLVDKPCIPTATFSVVKADGLVEEHRFQEGLYQKSDSGEADMSKYVPTNDEMLPVARSLAKAAGKSEENDWPDFMDAARDQLIAKADGQTPDGDQQVSEEPKDDANAPAQADEPAEKADKAKPEGDSDAAGSDTPKEGEEGAEDDGDEADEDEEGIEKADGAEAPEVEQGWRAKDGSFHVKKADAIAHNEKLAKGDVEPSLVDTLTGMVDTATKLAKGEEIEDTPEPGFREATIAAVAGPLAKLDEFNNSDVLAKGMYDVKEFASVLSNLRYVHSSLVCEAAWEDDNSTLPKEVFDNLVALGNTFVAVAEEEVKRMIASAKRDGDYEDDVLELAASTLGLEKAAFTEELAKRAPGEDDTLQKLDAANQRAEEAVAKAAKLEEDMGKIGPLVKSLQEQIDVIKKMPRDKAPTTRVVTKGDDRVGGSADTPDLTGKTAEELADLAIKFAQSNGRVIGVPAAGQ